MHGEEDRATHIRTDIISYVYMSILDAILSGAQLDSYPSLGPNYAQTCWTCCSFQSFMYCTILFEQHHTSCTQISLEILTYMCLPHPSCDAFSLRCISYIPCDALCLFQHLLLSCLAFIFLFSVIICQVLFGQYSHNMFTQAGIHGLFNWYFINVSSFQV